MISITESFIEQALKQLLQHQIDLSFGEKVWREGQLILFKQDGFFLELILKKSNRKRERFEIPIPFDVRKEDATTYVFSYKLDDLTHYQTGVVDMLKKIANNTRSKFFDTNLYVKIRTGEADEV